MLGSLLVAMAIVGSFLAASPKGSTPSTRFAVAARPLALGDVITVNDLDLAPMSLPDGLANRTYTSPDQLIGAVVLRGVAQHDLITFDDTAPAESGTELSDRSNHEMSFAVPAERIPPRVSVNDRVTVLATTDDALGAIDIVALRNTGRAQFNQSEIVRIANQTVAASNLPDAQVVNVVLNDPDSLYPQLRVTLRLRVALLMTPMVPGAPHQTTITRTGTVSIFGFDYLQPG